MTSAHYLVQLRLYRRQSLSWDFFHADKIETQTVGCYLRAFLLHELAQLLFEHSLQDMSSRVMSAYAMSAPHIDASHHAIPNLWAVAAQLSAMQDSLVRLAHVLHL